MIFRQEKGFYKTLLSVALPVAGASVLQNAVGLADTFMVGMLGGGSIAAVTGANRFFFIFWLLLFGLVSGGTVLAAQYWGRRDIQSVARIAGIVLRISMTAGLLFCAAALLVPRAILSIFSGDPEVVTLGAGYLRIVAVTFLTSSFSAAYANFLRAIEKPGLSLAVQVISFFGNIALNSVFIFGLLGMPKLGVNGAALGTLISRLLEFFIVLFYARRFRKTFPLRLRDILHPDKVLLRDFVKHSGPVVLNEVLWGTGDSMHMAVLGHISTAALTAASAALSIFGIVTVFAFGMGAAAAVICGKTIGQNRFDEAKQQSKLLLLLTLGISLGCCAVWLFIRNVLVDSAVNAGLLRFTAQTTALMKQMMLLIVFVMPLNSVNCTLIVGILRSGGDTKMAALFDVGFMWLISLPAAAFAAFVLHWPPIPVMILLYLEEALKTIFSTARVFRWKWMRNVTRTFSI